MGVNHAYPEFCEISKMEFFQKQLIAERCLIAFWILFFYFLLSIRKFTHNYLQKIISVILVQKHPARGFVKTLCLWHLGEICFFITFNLFSKMVHSCVCVFVCVCVCVCVCLFPSFHRKGFSWLNKTNVMSEIRPNDSVSSTFVATS